MRVIILLWDSKPQHHGTLARSSAARDILSAYGPGGEDGTSTRAVSTVACGTMRGAGAAEALPQLPLSGINPLLCIVPAKPANGVV